MDIEFPAAPRGLHRHFARHNRRVWLLASFSLLSLTLLWGALYAACYWLTLLALSVSQGLESSAPESFTARFVACALLFCAAAYVARILSPARLPRDRSTVWSAAGDLLLALPKATLSLKETFAAFHSLKPRELGAAWVLLQAIAKAKRLDMASLALHAPNRALAEKLVLNLQLVGLVEVRRAETGLYLSLRDAEARAVCSKLVRIRPN